VTPMADKTLRKAKSPEAACRVARLQKVSSRRRERFRYNRSHGQLFHLLLDEYKTPKFIFEPIEVLLRSLFGTAIGPTCSLEGVEA
jgi:hypothetical protein